MKKMSDIATNFHVYSNWQPPQPW